MDPFANRKFILLLLFLVVSAVFISRLFYIQVIDSAYKMSASNNVLRYVTAYPARGLIYDRDNKLLVYNQPAYDLMVIPKQVKSLDTAGLCNLLGLTEKEVADKMKEAKKYSSLKPSVFLKQLSAEIYGAFLERMYQFPGFFVQVRTMRKYPAPVAAHILGYISEVDEKIIKKNPYYKAGDYKGFGGLEQTYEEVLRGKRGVKIYVVDVHNRIVGNYLNGIYDTLPVPGMNVICTIDRDLQEYAEKLMQNKVGSVAAIEPSTGEILALVTSPSYDPNLLVGRVRSINYKQLLSDSLNPLFNRALMAMYPPGSTFKLVEALVGLEEGAISEQTVLPCNKALVNCHNHPSPQDLHGSIQYSCNPYYYMVFKKILYHQTDIEIADETLLEKGGEFSMQSNVPEKVRKESRSDNAICEAGLDVWRKNVVSFGLGKKLGIDLPGEKGGYIPTSGYYNRIYGQNRWNFYTIYSLGIGQGEIMIVPLQMANIVSIIANRGYYFAPHLIKAIGPQNIILPEYTIKHPTAVSREYFTPIVNAMEDVVKTGTGTRAKIDTIAVCGKTGTAQNPHGEDHSVFIAFAPKDNPKIAVSVVVENSGFGGTWAAPIAGLIIEKYLRDTITRPEEEKRILEEDFIHKKIPPLAKGVVKPVGD